MDDTLGKMAARRRATRAKAQRKYAAKRKKQGTPSSDQVARAVVVALQEIVSLNSFPPSERKRIAEAVTHYAVEHLVANGLDHQHARDRLLRTLLPDDVSR
jgi:hypothetical protein